MGCVENGRDRRSEARFRNVARTPADRCCCHGSRASEYVLFDCSIEISLNSLLA